ncbi:xylitol dehydrogenase [Meredithblackwellia eburnea MCA 4105]
MAQEDLSTPANNLSFVLHGIKDVRFEERPSPAEAQLGPNDVIVSPKKTGICGSDTHYLLHGKIGDFVVKDPMVLGHESAGVVVKLGSQVQHLKAGDRVALDPGESCRTCISCKEGHYERCPDMVFAATPPYDGTLCGFYKLPADLCYKLPENVSLEEGALLEPLSVAVMAVDKIAKMRPSSIVVVFGAGPVGLLTMAVAKALGAKKVVAVDIVESRLQFAKTEFGAASDYFLPPKREDGEEPLVYSRRSADALRAKFGFEERGPSGVDLAIDCTGAPPCIQTGMYVVKHGGTYVQVGMGPENVTIPMAQILNKELSIKGSFRYGPGCYSLALDLVARGAIDVKPLITHRYSFKEAKEAFQANQDGKGADGKAAIKIMISGP